MFFADPCHPLHWIRPKIHSVVLQNSRFSDGLIQEDISFFEEYSSFSFCQIDSVRDADEHPTSRRIDSIRRASDFSSEERLEKASSVYEAWRKKNSGSTAIVEMLIVSRLLVSFSLKYWLKEMAELKEKKACIEALAQSGTEISGLPKELSGYVKMGHVMKDV